MIGEDFMKRLITLTFTIIAVLCLTACSVPMKNDTSRKNGLNCAFQSEVSVVIEKLEANGTLRRFGDGVWDIEFSSPNSLSGVKLEFNEGSVTASYKGLSFSVPQSALPVKAMMLNLIKAVDDNARLDELKGEEDGELLKISGELEGGEYILSVDKNGSPSCFEMPNNQLTITFLGLSVIGESSDGNTEVSEETTAEEEAPSEETTSAEETASSETE